MELREYICWHLDSSMRRQVSWLKWLQLGRRSWLWSHNFFNNTATLEGIYITFAYNLQRFRKTYYFFSSRTSYSFHQTVVSSLSESFPLLHPSPPSLAPLLHTTTDCKPGLYSHSPSPIPISPPKAKTILPFPLSGELIRHLNPRLATPHHRGS